MKSWAVTGTGAVSVAGNAAAAVFDAASVFDALTSGGGAARYCADRDVACAPIEDFDPRRHLDRKGLGDLSRTSQLACVAAARLAPHLAGAAPAEVGVALGTAWGSLRTVVAFERAAHVDGPRFVDPFLFAETVANVPAGQVAIVFGWSACNATIASGTASGLSAICAAIDLLAEERAAIVVAGGADELNPPLLDAWRSEGRLTADAGSLPCARTRSGPVAGEGACLLSIESLEHAFARGARPLARIVAALRRSAAGGSIAARHAVAGLAADLMSEAGIAAGQIDLIVISANGDRERDAEEALGVMEAFGRGDASPPIVAPKAALGETWGAAGALAAVVAIEAMRRGTIPASSLGEALDPALAGLRFPRQEIRRPVRHALVLDGAAGELIAGIILESPGAGGGHAA